MKITIGLIQMKVGLDQEENIKRARKMMVRAIKQGAEIIVLPEMFTTPYGLDYFDKYSEVEPGRSYQMLQEISDQYQILIIGGSIPEKAEGKLYNTSYVFEDGRCLGKHRKVHLFDVNISGGIHFEESKVLSPGEEATLIDTSFGTIGLAICYDMRFPGLFQKMADQGAQMVFIPAAFNMTTGPLHWHLLGRTRAVDYQIFTILCSPARHQEGPYEAYGHSLVASPWGAIKGTLDDEEGILITTIDLEEVKKARQELPTTKNRRPKIYF